MKPLPSFVHKDIAYATDFMSRVLRHPNSDTTFLIEVQSFDDHHFRAIFDVSYFYRESQDTPPSKSQWNSLKKKLKRHNPTVFVFKDYGLNGDQAYLEFGFLAAP